MKRKLLYITAALLVPIGMAHAGGPPEGKEGLWSLNRQTIDNPGSKKDAWVPIKVCLSHAYNQYVLGLAKSMPRCTTLSESTQGNKTYTELRCVVGNTIIDTKSTTTFEGDTSIHAESHTTYTPAMNGNSETIMTSDSKYIGSCPAGMQAGDRLNANGTISHSNWKH